MAKKIAFVVNNEQVNNLNCIDPIQQIINLFAYGLANEDCHSLAIGAEMFLSIIATSQTTCHNTCSAPKFKRK